MTNASSGWHISCRRPVEYDIIHCRNVLDPRNDALLSVGKTDPARRFVVVDENVRRIHGEEIRRYFDFHNVEARIVTFSGGEQRKSVDNYLRLLNELDTFPIDRRDEPIIAIGGGVLTDVVGFVAGTYRRGVPHIKVPTTLIGYIDAAIGVKTGVNFNQHKNRIGSFEPPIKVLLDAGFLSTLPRRHILNGVCEMLKLALIADLPLFELLEMHGAECIRSRFQDETGSLILDHSIEGMVEQLQPDLFECDLARKMDFGHTFSYGLETAPGSQWLHGEAVLTDMLISSTIARERGLLSPDELKRLLNLVAALGLQAASVPLGVEVLWVSLEDRTLHRDGWQRIPLPRGIGGCTFVNDVERSEVEAACAEVLETCRR